MDKAKSTGENTGVACVGCRLRRKKCDRLPTICSGCKDLQIPLELCIYRKMGLASKDSRATLLKEKKKNRELRDDKARADALLEFNRNHLASSSSSTTSTTTTGKNEDYYTVHNPKRTTDTYKAFQLNPNKNPLLCTVLSNETQLSYLGSTSVMALTESEFYFRPILQQVCAKLICEKEQYDTKLVAEIKHHEDSQNVNAFKERCLAKLVGYKNFNGDEEIIKLVSNIENVLPKKTQLLYCFEQWFRFNCHRWVMFPYIDEKSFMERFNQIVMFDEQTEAPYFKIDIFGKTDDLLFIALILIVICHVHFSFYQREAWKSMGEDYILLLKYAHAIMKLDLIGEKIRSQDSIYAADGLMNYLHLLTFEKYTTSNMFDTLTNATTGNSLHVRLLITFAISANLHKDLDRYYPQKTLGEKKSMKTVWYQLILLELAENMDVGFISKVEPSNFRRHDYCYNHLIEAIHVIHGVMFNYNIIDDMGKVDDLVPFIETKLIQRLKNLLITEFKPMNQDLHNLRNYNFDDLSSENLEEYNLILQRTGLRLLVYAIILTFYHICYKRLEQPGQTNTDQHKRIKIVGWKYSLTIMTLIRDFCYAFNKACAHKNSLQFHTNATFVIMSPFIELAQQRVMLFVCSRFCEMFNVDSQSLVDYILYKDEAHNSPSMDEMNQLPFEGLYSLTELEDFDIDEDLNKLSTKFSNFQSGKFLVISFCKMINEASSLIKTKEISNTLLRFNKILNIVLMKVCSYLLNTHVLLKPERAQISENDKFFDFKTYFSTIHQEITTEQLNQIFILMSDSKKW